MTANTDKFCPYGNNDECANCRIALEVEGKYICPDKLSAIAAQTFVTMANYFLEFDLIEKFADFFGNVKEDREKLTAMLAMMQRELSEKGQ